MIELLNEDCMEVMARYPDKYFDLAVVDPPYGIDAGKVHSLGKRATQYFNTSNYDVKEWDKTKPPTEYFQELFRVSKKQIIWGANHFTDHLPPSRGWCFWDKGYSNNDISYSMAELAFTSFDMTVKKCILKMSDWRNCISSGRVAALQNPNRKIHPTQKPIKLYQWILSTYLKGGGSMLDTHLGSGSSAIAAHQFGIQEFVGCEIDKDYYDAAVKRFNLVTSQTSLFQSCI